MSNTERELLIKWLTDIYKELDSGIVNNPDHILAKLGCALDILGMPEKSNITLTTAPQYRTSYTSSNPIYYKDRTPSCVTLAENHKDKIPKDSIIPKGLSSEVADRVKEMLKADEIKFNKIMEEFDE